MTRAPRYSFLLAAYQAEDTVVEAVRSLLAQSGGMPFEVIAVDDGSSDATLARLRSIEDERLRVVALAANVGRSAARNAGAAVARGEYLAVADADDLSLPDRLIEHDRSLLATPAAAVVGGQLTEQALGGRGPAAPLTFPHDPDAIDRRFRRGRMGVAHPASAFRRDWFDRLGGYDERLAWAEDYDLFARGWAPGRYVASSAALVVYRRDHVRTPWPYWWENERHLSAINARIADTGRRQARSRPIDPYLADASTPARKVRERARRTAVLARDALR